MRFYIRVNSVVQQRLQVQQLLFSHPDTEWSLHVPTFTLRSGEFRVIIGPNGSGKSTFLRLIAGLLTPKQGSILLNGQDIHTFGRQEIARQLGFLPSETSSEFDYRVYEIVAMGRYPYLPIGGFMRGEDRAVVERVMRQTDILHLKDRQISHVSDGERQRTFLASVLAQEPSLILLDEPTNALDIHHQVQLFTILKELTRHDISVLTILHDVNMASMYGDELSLFENGRIVKNGVPSDIVTSELLSAVYRENLLVMNHPQTGRPLVFPGKEGDRT
jgi:ABC-type cobalamin/Fe3+-siderophores transport system ATPase subunit